MSAAFLAFHLAAVGCGIRGPATVVDEDVIPAILATAPVIEHHAHIRSAAATEALLLIQTAVGQRIVDDEDADAVTGADLIEAMDAGGVERATVLSLAYFFGIPEVEFPDEQAMVRAENDFVAETVAAHRERLVGFCAMNPLAEYALEEAERCAALPGMVGLKLHLANSNVDLRNGDHLAALAQLFARADELGLAFVVHMRTRHPEYGSRDAEAFIENVLSHAPRSIIQIAHLAGWGGYDEATDNALGAFIDMLEARPNDFEGRLFFDLAATAIPSTRADGDPELLEYIANANARVADAIRRLGLARVHYGTDWDTFSFPEYLHTVREDLPLAAEELHTVMRNIAPYFEALEQQGP